MAARRFSVTCNGSTFHVDYDAGDGLEVFKFQLFSLTSIPPDQQKIIGEDDGSVLSEDSDLLSVSGKLQLLSIDNEKSKEKCDVIEQPVAAVDVDALLRSDEELAQMLQAEEEALMVQQFVAREQSDQFEERLRPYVDKIFMYEDPVRQEAARKTVPVDELEEKALVSLAKVRAGKSTQFLVPKGSLSRQRLNWTMHSYCNCYSGSNNHSGGSMRLHVTYVAIILLVKEWVFLFHLKQNMVGLELNFTGWISQLFDFFLPLVLLSHVTFDVHLKKPSCNSCSTTSRFPRYNDPLKLLESRRGRCGEWANCFTLYCRAFGYETRLILDFTDHVWTECYSDILGRWMHLDPCEAVYDKPLLYEKGWGKKLSYVIGFSKDGVCDVTKRYTTKWPEVLSRRNITTEHTVSVAVTKLTKECRRNFTSQALSLLEVRDKSELDEFERGLNLRDDLSLSLPGRQSGAKEWRMSRSEIGNDENGSISCSSCPTRMCIDEHVTRVYDAIARLLSQCVENSLPRSKVNEMVNVFKKMLMDVRNSPHKTRRITVNPFLMLLFPYFNELLCALSLKINIDGDGKIDICLAEEPVYTSLTLPVVLDALDDTITNLEKLDHLDRASITLPLAKSNRIHSGLVLASGEEFPFGIVTSAFDGLQASKWEEPNGGRGGWILYSLKDSKKCELEAYEITSANDAPERDPKDWIVDGSDDGGSNWHILDTRTSELFQDRFQCRSFEVRMKGLPCNAFRFRFLAARDIQSNSRLQLCSINLYTNGK
ncbi:Peptide-N(4)-(N-acetyl-beta-glucosaminyl)asparagine amidase [Linum grandiflorum]